MACFTAAAGGNAPDHRAGVASSGGSAPLKALQEQELTELALTLPAAQQLMQIDGFGAPTADMWLGEVGEVACFASADQLGSYAGLDPLVDQSGPRVRTGPITKAGRRSLRWIMVEVARRHVNSGGPLAEYFQRPVK